MRLEELRAKRGVSGREVARALKRDHGVKESSATIARWFDGSSMPSFAAAIAVADYFGVSLESLAGRETVGPEIPPTLRGVIARMGPDAALDRLLSIQSSNDVPDLVIEVPPPPAPEKRKRS